MKADIHPTYHMNAVAKCACGAEFLVASIEKNIELEICSNCHPFFTGNTKIIDTAGRVEKFQARRKAAASKSSAKVALKKSHKVAVKEKK
ncbi:50S ribosomal protein L31 [bacterium]|nr:50S ribosomal protein L31 [bacterium]